MNAPKTTEQECCNHECDEGKTCYPFAPGVISDSDRDLHDLDAGCPLAFYWYDWVAGAVIVVILGVIAGSAW